MYDFVHFRTILYIYGSHNGYRFLLRTLYTGLSSSPPAGDGRGRNIKNFKRLVAYRSLFIDIFHVRELLSTLAYRSCKKRQKD